MASEERKILEQFLKPLMKELGLKKNTVILGIEAVQIRYRRLIFKGLSVVRIST
jgi:hypothetical protein